MSLPGQIAAVKALQDPAYYHHRYRETHQMRTQLAADLADVASCEVVPGVANYLLCHLPATGPDTTALLEGCRQHNLFLRDVSVTSGVMDSRTFRIAVKDSDTNRQMVETIGRVLSAASITEAATTMP